MESIEEPEDVDNRQLNFPRRLMSDDTFYRAVHPKCIQRGELLSTAFANPSKPEQSDRMSVDWAEKSTYQETYDRRIEKFGDGLAVVSITAELCWSDGTQTLEFSDTAENPAHSDVIGRKSTPFRKMLAKKAVPLIYGDLMEPSSDK